MSCLENRSSRFLHIITSRVTVPATIDSATESCWRSMMSSILIVTPRAPPSPTKSAFPIKSCRGSMPVLEHSTALHSLSRNEPDILPFVLNCSSALPPKRKNNCGGKKQVAIPLTMAAHSPEIFPSTVCYKLMYGIIVRSPRFATKSLQVPGLLFLCLGSGVFFTGVTIPQQQILFCLCWRWHHSSSSGFQLFVIISFYNKKHVTLSFYCFKSRKVCKNVTVCLRDPSNVYSKFENVQKDENRVLKNEEKRKNDLVAIL